MLKLMFAFDHINYAGYITHQQIYLNNLLRQDDSVVKNLIVMGTVHHVLRTRSVPSTKTL